jgi:hypothetical protein
MPPIPLATEAVVHGADAWICFYPSVFVNYFNQEPGEQNTRNIDPAGFRTGVPQLGSMFMCAFVGEQMDTRWFHASDAPDDWGDGSTGSGEFTHTYAEPGFYWITTAAETDGKTAARLVKVIYRDTDGPGRDSETADKPVYATNYGYTAAVDPVSEGTVNSAFAFRFSIPMNGTYPEDVNIGYTLPLMGAVIFVETWEDGDKEPQIRMVCGGFVRNRTLTLTEERDRLVGTAYDFLYTLNRQFMQEQQYDSLAQIGYSMMQEAYSEYYGQDEADQDPEADLFDFMTIDWTGAGYVPMHFMAELRPDYAAAHLLHHVRIRVSDEDATLVNPPMFNVPAATGYGHIAQFTDIIVDPEFNEATLNKGFHGFSLAPGNLLPNINQILENSGSIFHSRSDMSLVMGRKPFYKDTLPEARLSVTIPEAIAPLVIFEGEPDTIWRVQVNKPMLGTELDPADLDDAAGLASRVTSGTPQKCEDLPGGCRYAMSGGCGSISASPVSFPVGCGNQTNEKAVESAAGKEHIEDALTQSVNQADFMVTVECGESGGQLVGPIDNVYTTDLAGFAVGVCREKRAHWQIVLPIGNEYDVDLGDLVAVTYTRTAGIKIEWVEKLFWVTKLQLYLDAGRYTRQLTMIEAKPEFDFRIIGGGSTNLPAEEDDECYDGPPAAPTIVSSSILQPGLRHSTIELTITPTTARQYIEYTIYVDGAPTSITMFAGGAATSIELTVRAGTSHQINMRVTTECGTSGLSNYFEAFA